MIDCDNEDNSKDDALEIIVNDDKINVNCNEVSKNTFIKIESSENLSTECNNEECIQQHLNYKSENMKNNVNSYEHKESNLDKNVANIQICNDLFSNVKYPESPMQNQNELESLNNCKNFNLCKNNIYDGQISNSMQSLINKSCLNEKSENSTSNESSQEETNSETAFSIESDCIIETVGNFTSNDCSGIQSAFGMVQTESAVTNTLNQVSRRLSLVCESAFTEGSSAELCDNGETYIYSTSPHLNPVTLNNSVTSLNSAVLSRLQHSLPHTNSVPNNLSLCHVGKKNLSPIVPKTLPPPLEKNFSSVNLRTTYRCDSDSEINSLKKIGFLKTQKSSLDNLSTSSLSILPPISTKDARKKSYMVGSVRAFGSLLGTEELSRYFPDNKIKIFIGTWNMNSQSSPKDINDFLLPEKIHSVPDIYAIGVQEGMQDKKEWEILMQTSIGPSHVLFHSASLGVLYLAIFLRRDLIWFCSVPEDASINTRAASMVKTKGAVAICFVFFGTSFLFINSHLTAHEEKLKERLADYKKICNAIDLPKQLPLKPPYHHKEVVDRFDYVFWCGDLNFRLIQDRSAVMSFVEEKLHQLTLSYDMLLQSDQLHKAMQEGMAFSGFKEGKINFGPSYKFNIGTDLFDAKLRVPSYTDRVLYKSRKSGVVECLNYDTVPSIKTSDHKPVYAVFEVSIRPGRDNIPLAAGLFNRDVYLEAMRRRASALDVTADSRSSIVCSIM
ncbi:72 kDa inositol polyphosphate 5-phosphatase-like [Centruroides sculpturatus]|uniref:72 kDa inositol polyphosphate 5-phosphatase-like n=1 Tax=Centruroides sculpturatus TaxID=218467 RepID=UPI000C6E68F0|nr:72 kDa inositol polyphosphate 5-phosphatase-like [Centruroides sculpturatus]XP_023209796.1 72 kDa inositol polyphosphate 5-phosphatase-like [Centruroides sculpturatus]